MASMKSSSSSSSAAATELISRCSVGSVISITSNSSMRYEGVVESVHLPDELICLSNVRSFGTEGRRKDSALVLPDDRVFDNVQFRGSDIKVIAFYVKAAISGDTKGPNVLRRPWEWQVLSSSPAVQVLDFPHDPAIIQCRPLHPMLGGSAQDIKRSHEDGFDPNTGSNLTIEESLPSASPPQALMSFSASKLSTNYWKQPTQGVSGILGGGTCVRPHYSLDMQPTSADYNWKWPTQRSGDNMSLNDTFSSQVPLTASTPFQTCSPYISSSLDLSPITLNTHNLSPDVVPTIVEHENFPSPSLSFGSSATIPGKDTYAVSLQTLDRLSSLLGSCVPPQSPSLSMAPKNLTTETIHSNESELSSQESPNHVLPPGPLVDSFLHLRDCIPMDMKPLKNLVPDSGSRESKCCNKLIPSLSTHAKTSNSALKSASQTTTVSLSQPSAEKMNKGRVRDNMKVASQPERNIPMISSGKAIKSVGQTNVDNMKNGSADSHTFQWRQPRKICSFRRTNKVSQLPTNYLEDFSVRSVNGESDKTGVYNHSSKIVHVQLERKGTTRNIYIRKSEKVSDKVVHAKEDLFESPVPPERELTNRNSKMPDLQKMDAEFFQQSNGGPTVGDSLGRCPKSRGSAGGAGRGKAGRSQAESIGKHVT